MTTGTLLSNDDLNFVAEALLALCERDATRPFYTEDRLALRLKMAERREPIYGHLVSRQGEDPLLHAECRDVYAKAKLTDRQADVFAKRMAGWTFEEIGTRSGHTKQAAQNIFVQALKKIARSFRVYPFKGLSEVYRHEVRRGIGRGGLGRISTPAG